MKEIDRIQLISDLYHQGKLDAMQLCSLETRTRNYDIIVFMYTTNDNQYILLDYVYGATEFKGKEFAVYYACTLNYDRIYKALKKNKLLKGNK